MPGTWYETCSPGLHMQLGDQRSSSNVEDRRGIGMVGGGLGIGGIVVALVAYFLGVDPAVVSDVAQQVASERGQETREVPRGGPARQQGGRRPTGGGGGQPG